MDFDLLYLYFTTSLDAVNEAKQVTLASRSRTRSFGRASSTSHRKQLGELHHGEGGGPNKRVPDAYVKPRNVAAVPTLEDQGRNAHPADRNA